uniref:Uncharacterized protein n=1 Tax=Oryza glumipatula TaxID=40148 RepID=A0A0D9ZJI7_9ORYZ
MHVHHASASPLTGHQVGARHPKCFQSIQAVGLTTERVRENGYPLPHTSPPNVGIMWRLGAATRGLSSRSERIAGLQHPPHGSTIVVASGGLPASPPTQVVRPNHCRVTTGPCQTSTAHRPPVTPPLAAGCASPCRLATRCRRPPLSAPHRAGHPPAAVAHPSTCADTGLHSAPVATGPTAP